MKLLLHACCADCTTKFIQPLKEDLTCIFINPNIHPKTEYNARLQAMRQVCEAHQVKLIIPNYIPKDYFHAQRGGEEGTRCQKCWCLRLSQTAEYAAKNNYTHFSTTLLSSHFQSLADIQSIGQAFAEKYKLKFYVPTKIDRDLHTTGFYKQNYCGCAYSLLERLLEKYSKN